MSTLRHCGSSKEPQAFKQCYREKVAAGLWVLAVQDTAAAKGRRPSIWEGVNGVDDAGEAPASTLSRPSIGFKVDVAALWSG